MAMQRVRRLASVAVVAAVAVTGLSACRSQPDVAAYTAAGNITVARVQQVFDDARDKHNRDATKQASATPSPGPSDPAAAPARLPLTGTAVLNVLISHDVLMRAAQRHKVQLPSSLPIEGYASALKLPVDSEYLRLLVEVDALGGLLAQSAAGGTLSQADIREIYDRVRAQNALDANTTPEQFGASLPDEGKKALGTAVTIRNEVRDDISRQHIRLNPRYQAFEVPVLSQRAEDGSALVLLAVPVGDRTASAPVTDVD